jgi:SagB-type dehydrogenase family enzyme
VGPDVSFVKSIRAVGPRRGKPARGRKKKPASYRRCASLVVYWQNERLIFENFALRTRVTADPFVCSILDFCGEWRSLRQIQSQLQQYEKGSVRDTIRQLCVHGLLEQSDHKRNPREAAMRNWADWNPAAGFFHFSTKDVEFAEDPWAPIRKLQERAKTDPMPVPVKSYTHASHTKLPRIQADTEFPQVLKARRTWRKYSEKPVELEALAATLELTFGIQGWASVPGLGKAAMKTSPSGGSLHPIEAYVIAPRVSGLRNGIYHYNAAQHELDWLRHGISREDLKRYLGHQNWFADTGFLVLMTAVFPRTQWKYDFARVYRAVLLEAGHLCQTFCLSATWLGLAPFCTIALADTKWESLLGIDGITESVIYAAGAGMKPHDDADAHIGKIGKGPDSRL